MAVAINVGADEQTTIVRLAHQVQEALGMAGPLRATFVPYEQIGGRYQDVRCRIPDMEKAAKLLGLRASVRLDEGLVHTVDWHRARRAAEAASPGAEEVVVA